MVYDIGVSAQWGGCYRQWFKHTRYETIDINPEKKPTHLLDVESAHLLPSPCDVLICNGVTEQCNDVAALLRGCHALCKRNAFALFGCAALGYPMYGRNDRFRFTPHGLVAYLDRAGFKEIKHLEFQNTYLFATCTA